MPLPPGLRSLLLSPYALAGGYCLAFFAVNGALITRISDVAASYADPLARAAEGSIVYASVLGPLLGHVLGVRGETPAIALGALLVVLAIGALVWFVARMARTRDRIPTLLVLLALSPLLEVLLSWIGKPDPLLILSYILFAAAGSATLRNAGAFFMLLAHKEEGLIMLALHLLLFGGWREWRDYLPGTALGLAWFFIYGMSGGNPPGRIGYVLMNLPEILENLKHVPIIVFTSLGWFWLPLLLALKERALRLRLLLTVLSILAVTFLTVDATRVAAVLGLPLVLFLIRHHARAETRFPLPLLLFLALLSLVQLEWAGSLLTITHWHDYPWEQVRYWMGRYLGI